MTTQMVTKTDDILVCKNLSKSFNGIKIIDDLSFHVKKGELVTIVGPSGCGKSLLLRMLAGFENPDSGEIIMDGHQMVGVPPFKRKTAICVQNFALFPNMTVKKNVDFGLEHQGYGSNDIEEKSLHWIEIVGLKGFENRKIEQLSGGQKQRVALARALAIEPEILLLDEPLGALDANLRYRMQGEIKGLQQNLGITIIHVTGSESEAMSMADRMIMFNEGKIEQEGVPKEIFRNPASKFVASFMGNYNLIDGKYESINQDSVSLKTEVGLLIVGDFSKTTKNEKIDNEGTVIIRVDKVEIMPIDHDTDCDNILYGFVRGVEFKGSIVNFLVELENKQIFNVEKHQSRGLLVKYDYTGRVKIAWWSSDTKLLI